MSLVARTAVVRARECFHLRAQCCELLTGEEGHAPQWPELRQGVKLDRNGVNKNPEESRKDREGVLKALPAPSS